VSVKALMSTYLSLLMFCGLQDVETLVITMHAAFEESFVRAEDLWAAYLVPPGPAPVSMRTGWLTVPCNAMHCCCQHW
jgi:hypothetical protein